MMQVHRQLDALPHFENAVITIGSFDGVHAGHRKIISRLTDKAKEINGESVLITFHPHPRLVLDPKNDQITILSSLEEKTELLAELGVDHLVLVPFTMEFSRQSPEEYIEEFLIRHFNPKVIIIGYDHKFGKNRSGNIDLLKKYISKYQFELIEIEKHLVDQLTVSSTKIRKSLASAQVQMTNALLSYPYQLTGRVVHGDKIGRKLGYPTANIHIDTPYKLIPPNGIYAVHCKIGNHRHSGMLYIGNRSTVNHESKKVIEVHLLNFDQEIYNETIRIDLLKYIRDDMHFDSLEALTEQIAQDQKEVEVFFETTNSIKKKVAITVLNYNGADLLSKYIPPLIKYTKEDIIVVDNKSTDPSIAYLNTVKEYITIIELDQNYGFAEGYNRAIDHIQSYEYTLLLNSDVRVTAGWLEPLIDALDNDPSLAGVQPKIRSDQAPAYFEYAGASGGYMDTWGFPFCRGRIFDTLEEDTGQYDSNVEIHWCSGAAMLVRTNLYRDAGGLDSDFFAHQEEIDLCWRLRNAGYAFKVIPESIVYHLGGGTLSYQSPKKLFLNYRNNLTTILKNEKASKLWWLLPWRFGLDKLSAFRLLLSGDGKGFTSIIKALFYIVTHFPSILKKRKRISRQVKHLKQENDHKKTVIPHTQNIIIPYFLNRKNTFSKIFNS